MADETTQADDDAEEPKQEGNKGPAKRFSLRLTKPKDEDPVDTTIYEVSVTEPKKPADYLEAIPYHQEDEDPFPPGSADCYLQVWELDKYTGTGKHLGKADNDYGEASNRLVVSIPGCVIMKKVKKKAQFFFRSMGQPVPTRSFDKTCGRLTLKLTDTDEEEAEVKINLPEYEGTLEVAVCLSPTAATPTLQDTGSASGLTFIHNVHASVHKQIRDRDGIAVSCIAKYDEPVGKNDKEMEGQAKQILSAMPTFKVEDGKLRFGYYKVKGYHEIADLLAEVRKTAKEELGLESEPRVTTLFLFAHGIRQKLNLNTAGWKETGTLSAKKASDFVSQITPHVGSPLVIPLFACNNGRGERAYNAKDLEADSDVRMQGKGDRSYGLALVGEIPGFDSLGWHLHSQLEQVGIKHTVWAHTTTGHTTRNCRLRIFSSWGVGDFASCLYGGRKLEEKTRTQYGRQTNYSFSEQEKEIALQKLANANLIRSISTHSALYLDWSWVPGSTADDKDPLWRAQAATECQEVVEKFKALMTRFDLAPEGWTYEDAATKAHITGLSDAAEKTPILSKNFTWKELKGLSSPFRLSVKLIQAVQASLTANKSSATVKELIENGDGLVLKASKEKSRNKIKEQANLLTDLGLLKTVAPLGNKQLLLNVSGVRYDSTCEYVLGGPAEAYLTRSIKMGDFGDSPPSKINRKLLLLAQELMDQVKDAKLVGIDPVGEMLYLESTDPELERLAEEMEAGGLLEDASKVGDDKVRIATKLGVAVAP